MDKYLTVTWDAPMPDWFKARNSFRLLTREAGMVPLVAVDLTTTGPIKSGQTIALEYVVPGSP